MRLELTRRADYALRAMLVLAGEEETVSGPRIARTVDIPPRFIGQIMGDLVHAGLVETRMGRRGGYRLARPASAISVLAVIRASGEQTARERCALRGTPCATDGACVVHPILERAQRALLDELGQASLASALLAPNSAGGDGVA